MSETVWTGKTVSLVFMGGEYWIKDDKGDYYIERVPADNDFDAIDFAEEYDRRYSQ